METLPSFCRKFLIRNMPKACFAFLQKVFRGAVGTKRLRNVIRRFSFLGPILTAKRPAVILLRKNRWNLRPAKESESFIRVRGRQVRLWRPVQVRSLRSVRITAICFAKAERTCCNHVAWLVEAGAGNRRLPCRRQQAGQTGILWLELVSVSYAKTDRGFCPFQIDPPRPSAIGGPIPVPASTSQHHFSRLPKTLEMVLRILCGDFIPCTPENLF